ncbi:MAG: biotin--[acetyl-CoA-carboxylase] ligase [Holosporales bacterium]|jgi:BirA family biotin operon repressor/biotin-[acetyl-CoA-carboxylase] ligase|nr:biotin--[acetyl-CoA-carboxylase] ligase [Holosporales bacterium]
MLFKNDFLYGNYTAGSNFWSNEKCDSTNAVAKRMILDGEALNCSSLVGSIITSREQYSGYGTNGRSWQSPVGNLYVSIILPIDIVDRTRIGQLSLATSIAVANSIKFRFGVENVAVKWPNDILIGTEKVAGILIEIEKEFAVVGIGVNVENAPETGQPTTCLRTHCPRDIALDDVLPVILKELDCAYCQLLNHNFEEIKENWTAMCPDFRNYVKREGVAGIFVAIGESGEMILKSKDGPSEKLEKVFSNG